MVPLPLQPGLFDAERACQQTQAESARARMRETIDRLRFLSAPPWTDETAVMLQDGAFKRAMRLVPTDEAEALWAEFDAQMERLYAIWKRATRAALAPPPA